MWRVESDKSAKDIVEELLTPSRVSIQISKLPKASFLKFSCLIRQPVHIWVGPVHL